ncbi:hypothetical protein [Bosea robiniae]|uniref:Uncharacterized protein n=1 Tax=Bosea robiniae TaxID=1036780 RepID=A0ABY0P438_9HYPH|nr:hypothetical protein [Bosea robiniae]SDH20364.1 hypothetical protein SAMN05421844_107150 [Bosea robiniae]
MKSILKAIGRALLAIPKMAWTVCRYTGAMVLSIIPQPQAMTTAAGEVADAVIEAEQAKQAAPAAKATAATSQAEIAYTYAIAMITGSRPPSLDGQPAAFVSMLDDLTHAGARALIKASIPAIELHLSPRCPADHLAGVPSIGARPMTAAPVGSGSQKQLYFDALERAPKPEMCSDGEIRIFHDYEGEDQSARLKAA